MKKNIIKLIIMFIILNIFLLSNFCNAFDTIEPINYKSYIEVGQKFSLDLTNIKKELEEKYSTNIYIEWNTRGSQTIAGTKFEKVFDKSGEIELKITIYKVDKNEKNEEERSFIADKNLNLFVFNKKINLIIDSKINKNEVNSLIEIAKNSGNYLDTKNIDELNIYKENILNFINKDKDNIKNISDYFGIWGEKDFILSILSKLNFDIENANFNEKINIIAITPLNINILNNYLNNFISNKEWIGNMILISDVFKSQIIKNSSSISLLEESLKNNEYDYLKIDSKNEISNFIFISKFINNLSNSGFNTKDIYIILLIPFLFIFLSILKQFIGLSTIGIIIPIFLSILFIKIGIFLSILFILTIFITNILIGKIISKYNLLYTPKVSLMAIINIISLIIIINILYYYKMINIGINDIVFLVLFIVISERLITIIISKEPREYITSLINTIFFAIISWFIFSIKFIEIFILAFPEIIFTLIPISFLIGKFSGLRITEYFRFREVIKNIEEE